jgi:hypothetical protein
MPLQSNTCEIGHPCKSPPDISGHNFTEKLKSYLHMATLFKLHKQCISDFADLAFYALALNIF